LRLLLDQNLSRRLLPLTDEDFVGSAHVASLGLATASDVEIWNYAREHGFAILSKDADFHHLSFLNGAAEDDLGQAGKLQH
jgi:predicted nuclease of predicted toxin-antitoxin system